MTTINDRDAASAAYRVHRTVVDVARERIGKPYEDGKRLTDTFQYVCRCMCGWVGPTMATAREAQATGAVHRADEMRDEALRRAAS